jgi:hypothetical protein
MCRMAWWPLLRERPSLAFRLNLRPSILVMPKLVSYWWRNPAKHWMRLHAMSDIPEPGICPGRSGREPMQALFMRLQSIGTQFRVFNERSTQGMKGMVRFTEGVYRRPTLPFTVFRSNISFHLPLHRLLCFPGL